MAELITRAFRAVEIIDLDDLTKGSVDAKQLTEISHDGAQELEEKTYEDSIVVNITLRKNLTGNITVKGNIEKYIYPKYVETVRTDPLFELDHYYLFRFLALSVVAGVLEMVYFRWVGQLVELPKETRAAGGDIEDKEAVAKISLYGGKGYDISKFYNATAGPEPGPADATPTTDYNPLFIAIVKDDTKTLEAAETEIGTIINPA